MEGKERLKTEKKEKWKERKNGRNGKMEGKE